MADEKKPKLPPPLPTGRPGLARPPAAGPRPPAPPMPVKLQGAAPRPPLAGAKPSETPAAGRQAPGTAPFGSSEVDEVRKHMETQIAALSQQLQDEREKLLMQTVRVKEEEAMAAKVEESLKDIQDRLRREKREQELQEALSKSENHIKELESRITSERQTWVETLKSQVNQRESQDKELERGFELKLKELERRWHEEKLSWSQALRNKDEEVARVKREAETLIGNERDASEKRILQLESERESVRRELKDRNDINEQERQHNTAKLEARDKDFLSLKAQQAMIVTQLRQAKEKEDQLRALLEKMRADKNMLISQVEAKDKDYFLLKTQFALYQTRAKTEQEKLLKEMLLMKEMAQKEREQWEVNFRTKENELRLAQESARVRETELKTQLDKKEHEAAAAEKVAEEKFRLREAELKTQFEKIEHEAELNAKAAEDRFRAREAELKTQFEKTEHEAVLNAKAAEDRFRARETETRYILDKKDEEVKNASKAAEEKIAAAAQEFSQQLAQKDKEARGQQLQWIERVQGKEKEIQSLSEKENELKVRLAQQETKTAQLEEKLKADSEIIAKERERAALKENEFKAAITKEEERFRNAGRELAEANARLQAMNVEFVKKEQKEAGLKNDIERNMEKITEQAIELEAKFRETAAFAEKEKQYSETLRQLEQKTQFLAEQLRSKTEEAARVSDKFERVETLNSALLEKERDWRVSSSQYEQKMRDNAEKAAALERELRSKEDKLGEKDTEKMILQERLEQAQKEFNASLSREQEKFEQARKEFNASFAREQERFSSQLEQARRDAYQKAEQELSKTKTQFDSAREELKNALNLKDMELREARAEKEGLKTEAAKINAELSARERELDSLTNDMAVKEVALNSEIFRKEGLFQNERAALNAKIGQLESSLRELQQKSGSEYERLRSEWKAKEDSLSAEKKYKDEAIATLKAENEAWRKEKDNVSTRIQEIEEKKQAELANVQRKLWENKESFNELLKEKDEALAALKSYQKDQEEKVRRELYEKYRSKIEELEKEKESLSTSVSSEVKILRNTLQADLKKKEEQLNTERLLWEARLREKDDSLFNLERKYNDLCSKINTNAAKIENGKSIAVEPIKTVVVERPKNLFEKTAIINPPARMEYIPAVQPIVPAAAVQPPAPAQQKAAEPSAVAVPAAVAEEKKGLLAFICALWRSINEPVIEIGVNSKEEGGKK